MPDLGTFARVGFFVGVLVVAGVFGALVGVPGGSAPAVDELDAPSFNDDEMVATVPEASGELTMSADAEGDVVVIDAGHGADIKREALAPMVTTLTENGATVKYHVGRRSGGRSLNASLAEADAFVILGAQSRYTEAELDGLRAFSDAGGRVLVMNEPESMSPAVSLFGIPTGSSGVPSPLGPVLSQYGMAYDNGYLFTQSEDTLNYRAVAGTPTGDGELTEGVDRVVLYEARPVTGAETVLSADSVTLSQTRREGSYGVVARSGNVVAVGDSSVATQEFLYRADNEQLVGNLLDFLVSGEKSPERAPEESDSNTGTETGTVGPA